MQNFTTNQFHTSQILLAEKVRRYSSWCSHGALGLSMLISFSTFIPSKLEQKLIHIGSAVALYAISNRLDELHKIASGYEGISQAQSHSSYNTWLQASMKPPAREIAIAAPIEPPVPIKFASIESSLKKPHLMILGETGSGKSTICKFLVSQVNAPCLIIDPHASPTDWRGFNVVGSGRNYQAIGEEFERLATLMQSRYEERDKGITQFDPLIVIIDEFPAIASALGKGATDTVKLLAREARKVSIRMCLLSQGAEVKTLGLEGEGSIRESFAMLRLGSFALTHAKQQKILEAIDNSDRPAMLDQLPCNLPSLSDNQTLPVLPLPDDYQQLALSPQPQTNQLSAPTQSQQLAPVFSKIIEYLDGRDWTRDNAIKQGITEFKNADTPISELQGYLQFLEVQGHLETRGAGRNGLEAKKILS